MGVPFLNNYKLQSRSLRFGHLVKYSIWQRLNKELGLFKDLDSFLDEKSFFDAQEILANIQSLHWVSFFWKKFFIFRNLSSCKKNFFRIFKKLLKKILYSTNFTKFKILPSIKNSVFFFWKFPWVLQNFTLFRFYSEPKRIKTKNYLKNKHETVIKNLIVCSFCQKYYLEEELLNLSLLFNKRNFSISLKSFNSLKVVSWHFCLFCNSKIFSFQKSYCESIPNQFKKRDNFVLCFQKTRRFSFFHYLGTTEAPDGFDFLLFKYLNKGLLLFLELLLFGSLKKKIIFDEKSIFSLNFFIFFLKKMFTKKIFFYKRRHSKLTKESTHLGGRKNIFLKKQKLMLVSLKKKFKEFEKVLLFFFRTKNKKLNSFSLFF